MIGLGGTFSIPLSTGVEFEFTPRKSAALRGPALPLRDYIADSENPLLRTLLPALERCDSRFCPLVLCGPSGTGKTALALTLAQHWQRAHLATKVLVLTAVDFVRAYAHAVDTDSLDELRNRFLQASLVVVDDLPHLSEKLAAQGEFRYLVDTLTTRSTPLILTSQMAPAELPFSADLRSRLAAGLILPLRWPGIDARREMILRYLASRRSGELSEETITRLAEAFPGPSARLFATLAHLVHTAETERRSIDDGLVNELLSQQQANEKIAPRVIISVVARHFQVQVKELKGPSRRQAIAVARGMAMYLLRQRLRETFEQIGQHFGGRDHTTVMHACQKTADRLATDPQLQGSLERIAAQLEELP